MQIHKITSFGLIFGILAAVLFSRLLSFLGVPQVVNFLHFIFVFISFFLLIGKYKRISSKKIIFPVILLTLVCFWSALLNRSGLINFLLECLIYLEPFILVYIMSVRPFTEDELEKLIRFVFIFGAINLGFSYFQYFILRLSPEEVQGVFLHMGAGAHINGAISLFLGLLILENPFSFALSRRQKTFYSLLFFSIVILTDSKQVLAALIGAFFLLSIFKGAKPKKALFYIFNFFAMISATLMLAHTVFPRIKNYLKLDNVLDGLFQKFSVFSLISDYHDNYFKFLFGLGPGHTVSRLAWLIPDYIDVLKNFSITVSPVTDAIWFEANSHYLTNLVTGSSMFSMFFTWAGVFGDLGILGFLIYSFLWGMVFCHFCIDDFSRLIFFMGIGLGFVFTWLEEPPFVVFLIFLIGIRWQRLYFVNKRRS